MAQTHKPFREILPTGTRFDFVGRTRIWILVSLFLVVGSVAMLFINKAARGDFLNWTIDFKGGTELIFEFEDGSGNPKNVGPGDVRAAMNSAGEVGFEVSDISWSDDSGAARQGILLRTPRFGAITKERGLEIIASMKTEFSGNDIVTARWSGDRLFLRSTAPFEEKAVAAFLQKNDIMMKPWADLAAQFRTKNEGTGEYNAQISVVGIDRQIIEYLEKSIPGVKANLINSYGVGAKAGSQLRNDGMRSLFYTIALIMLYLAFRFDVRYAPGAVAALFHDSILVIGVFALTWTEVSLTSIAALLTVIGYSVNDTVVIFDRIRENIDKLRDKKLSKVINISLNETMSRTLLTSATLFVVTLMMNIFGTGLVRNFAFAMNIGVIVGVYSSVFVASPLLLYINDKYYGSRQKS